VSTGSGGHKEKNREIKKKATIGNTVRGFFSSGHSRQDRYNDVCIKNHASYIVIYYILLISKLFFIVVYQSLLTNYDIYFFLNLSSILLLQKFY